MQPADIVRAIYESGWSNGDFEPVAGWFADQVPLHVGGRTRITDLDDLIAIVTRWRTAFSDLRFEIDDLVAAGDVVAVRATLRGTHRAEWLGIEPRGAEIAVPHAFFHRFRDGLLVEVWEILDRDLLIGQLRG